MQIQLDYTQVSAKHASCRLSGCSGQHDPAQNVRNATVLSGRNRFKLG